MSYIDVKCQIFEDTDDGMFYAVVTFKFKGEKDLVCDSDKFKTKADALVNAQNFIEFVKAKVEEDTGLKGYEVVKGALH